MTEPLHNHVTRDVKAPGMCAGCDFRVGQEVIYYPHPGAEPRMGTVTRINGSSGIVYVRFPGEPCSHALYRADLEGSPV